MTSLGGTAYCNHLVAKELDVEELKVNGDLTVTGITKVNTQWDELLVILGNASAGYPFIIW